MLAAHSQANGPNFGAAEWNSLQGLSEAHNIGWASKIKLKKTNVTLSYSWGSACDWKMLDWLSLNNDRSNTCWCTAPNTIQLSKPCKGNVAANLFFHTNCYLAVTVITIWCWQVTHTSLGALHYCNGTACFNCLWHCVLCFKRQEHCSTLIIFVKSVLCVHATSTK